MGILGDICNDNGIRLCELTNDLNQLLFKKNMKKGAAYAFKMPTDEIHTIVFDDNVMPWHKSFLISHEIGHCLMGHFEDVDTVLNPEQKEEEARIFSCVMLALMLFSKYNSSKEKSGGEERANIDKKCPDAGGVPTIKANENNNHSIARLK